MAFLRITRQPVVASMLEDDFALGGKGLSISSPSIHNEWPFLTIETFWEEDEAVPHLKNMHSMSTMLHNRVMLRKKAGLPAPYGEAYTFGIELGLKPGRVTYLNCRWVERDEVKQRDIYWTRTMCKIPFRITWRFRKNATVDQNFD